MSLKLKSILYSCKRPLTILGLLALSSLQALATEPKNDIDLTMWRMVWIRDFGVAELPHKDLAPHLEDFIRSVSIHTSVIDGQLMTTRASAGCNGTGRDTYKQIVTPASTIETIRDGTLHYEVIPAVYETQTSWFTTQKACSFSRKAGGETYDVSWSGPMEDFIMANAPKAAHLRDGNTLEWADEAGNALARFEKLPGISMHKHFWQLDPDKHEDDPILAQYFGPAKLSLQFPKISFYRFCERITAPIEITKGNLHISGEISSHPCDDISYLVGGQRFPYTPNANAPQNILIESLPKFSKYTLQEDGETRRLIISDEDGKALVHLISSDEHPLRSREFKVHIFDQLDDHEWIMEPTEYISAKSLSASNPIRILRHHGYDKEAPKTQASLVSGQDCTIFGFNVNGQSQRMNVYPAPPSWRPYDECRGEMMTEIKAEWTKAKNMLFDDNHLIFYDVDWNEVMRARRGRPLPRSKEPSSR